jgi:hypothetical protein
LLYFVQFYRDKEVVGVFVPRSFRAPLHLACMLNCANYRDGVAHKLSLPIRGPNLKLGRLLARFLF